MAVLVLRCGIQPSEIGRMTLAQVDAVLNPDDQNIITFRDEAALANWMARNG